MPVLSLTILASLYGTAAIGLAVAPLFTKQSVAITTGMDGTRSRRAARAPLNQRKKNMPKQHWWQIWRKKKKASSGQEPGVAEPPPQQRQSRRRRSSVNRQNNFVDTELDHVFEGFTAEHHAAHVDFEYRRVLSPTREFTPISVVQLPHAGPSATIEQRPRLRRRGKMPQLNFMKKIKPPSKKKTTVKSEPGLEPNISTFSDEYEHIHELARGGQGVVHLVRDRKTGELFTIKQTPASIDRKTYRASEPDEASILLYSLEPHKNILRVKSCSLYDEGKKHMANVVSEFCDAGDLAHYISDRVVPENFVLHFVSGMIDALALMHHGDVSYDPESDTTRSIAHRQSSYMHRDIKPNNIFLTRTRDSEYGLPTIVLGDFGLSQLASEPVGIAGTDGYYAPELEQRIAEWEKDRSEERAWLLDDVHNTSTDMYAFGVSLWEVMTKTTYYPGQSDIPRGFEQSSVSNHSEILALLKNCLATDPARRPTANSLHRLSADLKSTLRAWHEQSGQQAASPSPSESIRGFRYPPPSSMCIWEQGSSHYTVGSDAPTSTSSASLRVLRSKSTSSPSEPAANSPTIAIFPVEFDDSAFMNPRPAPPVPGRTGESVTKVEPLINLFTGEPANDVSSTIVETGNLVTDEPGSAFSFSDIESDESLYF